MARSAPLSALLEHTLEHTLAPSSTEDRLDELQRAQARYFQHALPLQLLAQAGAEGDEEVAEILARACRGQRAPANTSLDERLKGLYDELQEELFAIALPSATSEHALITYIDHLLDSLTSLSHTILTQRASLLKLLTSPSLAASPLPRPPSLAIKASSLRHASTTLSAARAKHSLLLGHAQASLVLPPVGEFAAQNLKTYDEELRKVRKEVSLLEERLDGYEKQVNLLEGGGGRRVEGGYRILLGEWEELLREEKEVRGDLRRLGWEGES